MENKKKLLVTPINLHIKASQVAKWLGLSYTAFINQAIENEVKKQVSIKLNKTQDEN